MRYRLVRPTMVLAFRDNHQAAVTIQPETIIDVIGPVSNDDRFLIVRCQDQEFHMFASDLAAHGRKVKDVANEQTPGRDAYHSTAI
jgi:hypothetical protein